MVGSNEITSEVRSRECDENATVLVLITTEVEKYTGGNGVVLPLLEMMTQSS